MLKRPIGKSGIEGTALALGTWAIGGWLWGGTDEKNSIEAIQASIDAGITLIDTAPVYGMGKSEEICGKAIAGRRDEVVIATKCALVWHTDKGTHHIDQEGQSCRRYLNPDSIKYEVEESLKRLKVDAIDLLQTHWQDDGETHTEDAMAAMLELKDEGKIRAIGASNVEMRHIKEYTSVGQLDNIQNKYSMLDRQLEEEILPYCLENDIAVFAYSPLSMGLLTGKIEPGHEFKEDDIRSIRPRFSKENVETIQPFLNELREVAAGKDCTMSQLVIAWTLMVPGITHVLVGARDQAQAVENAKAGDLRLTQEEFDAIQNLLNTHSDCFVA
jgi:methylglyoxal reductase